MMRDIAYKLILPQRMLDLSAGEKGLEIAVGGMETWRFDRLLDAAGKYRDELDMSLLPDNATYQGFLGWMSSRRSVFGTDYRRLQGLTEDEFLGVRRYLLHCRFEALCETKWR